jgi:hypothetical protein
VFAAACFSRVRTTAAAASTCGKNGASVRDTKLWILHEHAAGNIVLAVPCHGVNDVPLIHLELQNYKATAG